MESCVALEMWMRSHLKVTPSVYIYGFGKMAGGQVHLI